MTNGMGTKRLLVLAFFAYVALDFGCPMVPGAFSFDPDESVDAVSACRARPAVFPRAVAVTSFTSGVQLPDDNAAPAADLRAGTSPIGWRPHAGHDHTTTRSGPRLSLDED
jgi:hypothetical protein